MEDFMARRLDSQHQNRARDHLDGCPECRRLVAELARGAAKAGITRDRLGRYLIDTVIGEGAMGIVYHGHDPELDRPVAVKLLHSDAAAEATRGDVRERLQREARAMARLSHPNVVTVFDVGTFDDQLFVAMEFVDGRTLGRWLAEEPRDARAILDVFVDAGRGLAAAHAAGLVHRDFKPDNVLVGKNARAKVTDFGLARCSSFEAPPDAPADLRHAHTLGTLTRSGAVVGTPAYMAPEQFRGGPVTPKTDQFSFCVALWEALYGERPFAALGVSSSGPAALPPRPPPRESGLRHIEAALVRGLSTAPDERFPSMDELLTALTEERGVPRSAFRDGLRRASAIALLLALGAVGLFVAVGRERGAETPTAAPPAPRVSAGAGSPATENPPAAGGTTSVAREPSVATLAEGKRSLPRARPTQAPRPTAPAMSVPPAAASRAAVPEDPFDMRK
jgi:predicted Ser/Thr protein kinase